MAGQLEQKDKELIFFFLNVTKDNKDAPYFWNIELGEVTL